ncbi:MAG: hypothetical protein PHI23_01895 [Candidatus Peribacteraceae bacterium]|nr:hypothetical protein [Candidatus Peribacteraceae bacterium]
MSVLAIGAIAMASIGTLLVVSLGVQRSGYTIQQSSQALVYAQSCAERALLTLREDSAYAGMEDITFSGGSCSILRVGGSGNENRSLCTEGAVGNTTRRLEIILKRLLPSTQVYSWQEVDVFSACSYE